MYRALILQSDPSGWWQGQNAAGNVGYFPMNYCEAGQDA